MLEETRNTIPALRCRCCRQPAALIPRDDLGTPGEYAVCFTTGRMHMRDPQGSYVLAPANTLARVWHESADAPAVMTGVRIDLSKEGYA